MKPHATDLVSLTSGLLFVTIAVLWLMIYAGGLPATALVWALPVGLLIVGLAGIVHVLRRPRS